MRNVMTEQELEIVEKNTNDAIVKLLLNEIKVLRDIIRERHINPGGKWEGPCPGMKPSGPHTEFFLHDDLR